MRIGGKHIVLSLTQRRLSAALVRGRSTVRVEAIDLDPGAWAAAWSQGMMPFDSELRRVLARLRAGRGTPVTVLYNSPSAVLGSFNLPGSKSDASAAARVRVRESNSNHTLSAAYPIAPAAASRREWAVLAISERDETANALFGWVTRAGARLESLVPMQFALAIAASRLAGTGAEVSAGCFIGRDWTAVACGSREAFHLIRVFELGFGAMADVHAQATHGSAPAMTGETRLFEIGVPFKNRDVTSEQRSSVLPLLSPIIQRLCIEIKQTLRFGVSPDDMPGTLALYGSAGQIPELVPALVEGVDMHVEPSGSDLSPEELAAPFAPGSIERAHLPLIGHGIGIRPAPLVAQESARSFRRATLVGAVLAATAIGGEFGWISYQRVRMQAEFDAMSGVMATTAAHRERQEDAREIALRSGRVAATLLANTPETPNAGRVLAVLADRMPETVRLQSIDLRRASARPTLTLQGVAFGPSDEVAGKSLNEFIASLTAAPEIASVELGATERDSEGGRGAARVFTLTVVVADQPPEFAALARFAETEDAE